MLSTNSLSVNSPAMRCIGLLGGMSWESTILYYQRINELVRDRNGGGLRSANLIMHSLDFEAVVRLQRAERWDEATDLLGNAAKNLALCGAETILICTNTMHLVADEVEQRAGVPLLHIADVTAKAVRAAGLEKVGLLATAFTMERSFYKDRLARQGVTAIVPEANDRAEVHRIIFEELCCGISKPQSKETYLEAAHDLIAKGAEGIILGCTEICLLISQADFDVPVFDTTELHAQAAVDFALSEKQIPERVLI